MMNHQGHDHPSTPAARQICRDSATQATCEHCNTAPATHIKTENQIKEWDDDNNFIDNIVKLMICLPCSEHHYDGTEDFPGVQKI